MSFTISINEEAAFEVLFAGPAGPTGPQGIQGIQGVPGQGVAAGGTTGQVLKKLSSTNYDTGWSSDISGVAWGAITGTLSAQTDLQSALDAKLSTSAASSTYLPLAGGYITGDIQSLNGSEFRTFQSPNSAIIRPYQIQLGDAVGTLTVDAEGISFNSSPFKQTLPFLGLAGYATEAWVTSGFYPLASNPSGFLTASALTPYLLSATAATTYQTLAGMSAYLTKDGNLTGITNPAIARSNLDLGSGNGVTFASATIQGSGANVAQLSPTSLTLNHTSYGQFTIQPSSGITFPDATTQTTAYAGLNATTPLAYDSGTNTVSISATPTFEAVYAYNGTQQISISPLLITVSNGGSNLGIDATGITFPDATIQTTAYTGGGGLITSVTSPLAVTSGDLSIDLTGYATESFVTSQGYITQGTADGLYYSISNPSGFIDAGALAGYATESWVYGQGFTTEAWVQSQGYLTSVPPPSLTGLTGDISWDTYSNTGRLLITGGNSGDGMFFSARLNFDMFVPNQPTLGDFWFNGTDFFYQGGGVKTIASQSWVTSYVNSLGFITSGSLTPYAPLAGATFTGAVGFNASTNFLGNVVVSMNSSNAALRINQRGTGNAITVEDSASPDATPFVVDQFGKVGIGVAPDATAAIKIDGNGMSFNGLVFNPTATAAHTGGANTLDLLVTINGVNYRLALRPA